METYNQEKIFEILSKKSEDKFIQIQRILSKMDSHEIAHCLESTPSEQRKVIWSIIDKSNEADVLSELGEEIQQDLFDEISNSISFEFSDKSLYNSFIVFLGIITPLTSIILSGLVKLQLPPFSAAKSIITEPGFIDFTISSLISIGAGLPGISAVVTTISETEILSFNNSACFCL